MKTKNKIESKSINMIYLGCNINQEFIDEIKLSQNTVLLYESCDALASQSISGVTASVQDSVDDLVSDGRAVCIDKREVLSSMESDIAINNDKRESILSTVLNDYHIFLLNGRYSRTNFQGSFVDVCYFSDVVDYALFFNEKYKPQLVFCSYTPHSLEAWIFMSTLEAAGIRIIRLISSPLPWVWLPVAGLSNNAKPAIFSNQRVIVNQKIENYVSLLQDSYEKSIPYYERILKTSKINKIVSNLITWRPKEIIKNFEKKIIFDEFIDSISSFNKSRKYAVYFLHYQPEMNTVPEAGIYCDQSQAIKKLAYALPEGMRLIVKEHPSTFSKRSDRRWRPKGFYKRIVKLPNTYICSIDQDTHEIIDSAKFVASISGVCLTECIARGIPAVTFNPSRFSYFPKNIILDASNASLSELRASLKTLISSKKHMFMKKLFSSLRMVAQNGFDGSTDKSYIPTNRIHAANNSKKASLLALQALINGCLK